MAKPMGMMSGCYFVGRAELLEWINDLLGINYNKVEDVSNGAALCQIIDAIHPGTVALGRVNFNAITEVETVESYKILQDSFQKNGITQYVDVATLCKGRYMAALEIFQWIHGYFEQMGGPMGYDGPGRRRQTKCKDPTDRGRPANKPAGMAKRQGGVPLKNPDAPKKDRPPPTPAQAAAPAGKAPKVKPLRTESEPPKPPKSAKGGGSSAAPAAAPAVDPGGLPPPPAGDAKQLKKRAEKLEQEVEQMAQERDFYYSKLRKIEDYCQENEDDSVVQQVLEILYEADEEHGFLPPDDEA
jgi:RP/EB family microtubule-associated protein